jgi:hypothetical protein
MLFRVQTSRDGSIKIGVVRAVGAMVPLAAEGPSPQPQADRARRSRRERPQAGIDADNSSCLMPLTETDFSS